LKIVRRCRLAVEAAEQEFLEFDWRHEANGNEAIAFSVGESAKEDAIDDTEDARSGADVERFEPIARSLFAALFADVLNSAESDSGNFSCLCWRHTLGYVRFDFLFEAKP
jgi:hypothetical protein